MSVLMYLRGFGPGNMHTLVSVLTCHTVCLPPILPPYNNNEPVHEISHNLVCATSKASVQPAHTRSLIRVFASRLKII